MNKQTILIVEGVDMVGKTTILSELSKQINIPVYKEVREERWYDHYIDLKYAEESRIQMLEQLGFSVIFDRSYISEFAYAHAYNRLTNDEIIGNLDKRYAKLGAKIIYLYKQNHCVEDKTHLIECEKYKTVEENYEIYLQFHTDCEYIALDTTDENLDNQIKMIRTFIGV